MMWKRLRASYVDRSLVRAGFAGGVLMPPTTVMWGWKWGPLNSYRRAIMLSERRLEKKASNQC